MIFVGCRSWVVNVCRLIAYSTNNRPATTNIVYPSVFSVLSVVKYLFEQ